MLTPIDIQSKAFKTGIGYDKKDVDSFITEILQGYEDLYRVNVELKDKVTMLNDGMQHYKSIESSLQKALILAEKTSEETIKTAEDKARNIEQEAITKAKEHTQNAKLELERVHAQTISLAQQFTKFRAQYSQLLNSEMELLNNATFSMDVDNMEAFRKSTASINDGLNATNPIDGLSNKMPTGNLDQAVAPAYEPQPTKVNQEAATTTASTTATAATATADVIAEPKNTEPEIKQPDGTVETTAKADTAVINEDLFQSPLTGSVNDANLGSMGQRDTAVDPFSFDNANSKTTKAGYPEGLGNNFVDPFSTIKSNDNVDANTSKEADTNPFSSTSPFVGEVEEPSAGPMLGNSDGETTGFEFL